MSIAFPCAAVLVVGLVLYALAAICADKDPDFSFFYLHPKERNFFFLAQSTDLGFHNSGCWYDVSRAINFA
jgi:hypothetical protein